jgi:uncharacterized protein (DUF2342 family)
MPSDRPEGDTAEVTVSGTRSTDPQPPNERLARLEEQVRANLEEMHRMRERLHKAEGSLAAVTYLGERIASMGRNLEELAQAVNGLSRRAVERPSAAGWSALAGWGSLIVAITALLVVTFHGH